MSLPHITPLVPPLALGLLSLLGSACGIAVDESYTIRESVERIELQLGAGEARLEGTDDDHVQVSVELGGLSSKTPRPYVEDGVLHLDYACHKQQLCGGELTVRAPRHSNLHLNIDVGTLHVDRMLGELEARVDTGKIVVGDFGGPLMELTIKEGTSEATLLERPMSVTMTADKGPITLHVPEGSYALDLRSDDGAVEVVAVAHDPEADAEVTAITGQGEVRVYGR